MAHQQGTRQSAVASKVSMVYMQYAAANQQQLERKILSLLILIHNTVSNPFLNMRIPNIESLAPPVLKMQVIPSRHPLLCVRKGKT